MAAFLSVGVAVRNQILERAAELLETESLIINTQTLTQNSMTNLGAYYYYLFFVPDIHRKIP